MENVQNHLKCVLFRFIRSSDKFNVVIRFVIIRPFYLFFHLTVVGVVVGIFAAAAVVVFVIVVLSP